MNLVNPYPDCNSKNPDACRLQTFVSRSDYEYLQCLRPRHGTITCVVNILFKEFCNELRRRSIESISDSSKLEQLLTTLRIGSTLDGVGGYPTTSQISGKYPGVGGEDTSTTKGKTVQPEKKETKATYKAPKL